MVDSCGPGNSPEKRKVGGSTPPLTTHLGQATRPGGFLRPGRLVATVMLNHIGFDDWGSTILPPTGTSGTHAAGTSAARCGARLLASRGRRRVAVLFRWRCATRGNAGGGAAVGHGRFRGFEEDQRAASASREAIISDFSDNQLRL